MWCANQLEGDWSSPESVGFGAFSGISVFSTLEGNYWCWWFLAFGGTLLRATYNGPPKAVALELPEVEQMLLSLRPEDGHA